MVFVDESSTNIALTPRYARAPKGERAKGSAPRNWGKNVTLISSITLEGMGPSMSIEGSSDTESFGLYMREVLCPALRPGQIVVMDNLSVHRSRWVRELIEGRGCQLWLLPSYSPDFNPIEEAFSKVKGLLRRAGARTLGALFEATGEAIRAGGREDRYPGLLRALRLHDLTGPLNMKTALGKRYKPTHLCKVIAITEPGTERVRRLPS